MTRAVEGAVRRHAGTVYTARDRVVVPISTG